MTLRHFWWRHFGAGRHYWRDLYLETIVFYDAANHRAKAKSRIVRELRKEEYNEVQRGPHRARPPGGRCMAPGGRPSPHQMTRPRVRT